MPLTVGEVIKVGLRLRAARFIDLQYLPQIPDASLEEAIGDIYDKVAVAANKCDADWPEAKALNHFDALLTNIPSVEHSAITQLKTSLESLRGGLDGDGDGVAHGRTPTDPTGIIELAETIEDFARAAVGGVGLELVLGPQIMYSTGLAQKFEDVEPQPLSGQANIRSSPRKVVVVLPDHKLDARHLVQIAYVVFHELVCHAFQAWDVPNPENPGQKCSWSEGWMDALAYEITEEWLVASSPYLIPLRGATAIDTARAVHARRYTGVQMPSSDVRRRREARDAYGRLGDAILNSGLASSIGEARAKVRRFSFKLNIHSHGTPKFYKQLINDLVELLLANDAALGDQCAFATLAFLEHGDLRKLQSELQLRGV